MSEIRVKQGRIIWAVDIYEKDLDIQREAITLLNRLARRMEYVIEPVYIFGPASMDWALGHLISQDKEGWLERATDTMQEYLGCFKEVDLLNGKILLEERDSVSRAAQRMAAYAEEVGADIILTATHAKKGLHKAWAGSFVESLLLASKTPILTFNPSFNQEFCGDRILFATDLSRRSQKDYLRCLELAKSMNSQVTIFHHLPNAKHHKAPNMSDYYPGQSFGNYDEFYKDVKKQREETLVEWCKAGEAKGIPVDYYVGEKRNDASLAILDFSKQENFGLIAMGSAANSNESFFFGSTTRKVIRGSECPVWAIYED